MLSALLLLLAHAHPTVDAMDEQGLLRQGLVATGDSLCDSSGCVAKSSQVHWASVSDSAGRLGFLRESALRLSERDLHGAAFKTLETARMLGGPQDTLRLEQARELFLGGETEAALGLNYALEKRMPHFRIPALRQRVQFFQELGMTQDAQRTRAALPADSLPAIAPSKRPSLRGWYSFGITGTRIHYAAVPSRLLELAQSTQGEPVLGTNGLDTLRSAGSSKEHAFGAGLEWSRSGRSFRLAPWGRVQLEARADTLLQWNAGIRLSMDWTLGGGRLQASVTGSRTSYRPEGSRQTSSATLGWSSPQGTWPWNLTLSGMQGRSLARVGAVAIPYTSTSLLARTSRALPASFRLNGSLGINALFSAGTRTVDSTAKVVEVSGMRDTILDAAVTSIPSWLSLWNPSTQTWGWNSRGRSLYTAPATLQHGLGFVQSTPASYVGPQASLGLEWKPLKSLAFSASGTASWKLWLERSRWSLAELGRDTVTGLVTLWHNREDGRWFVVEPNYHEEGAAYDPSYIDRRIIPMESFSRRRQDLDLSLTLGGTLDLGLLGSLEGQWSMEHNWSNVDDKDADRNVWDLRSVSLGWSLEF